MKHRSFFLPLLAASSLFAVSARAQEKIYQCGKVFSTKPCEGGGGEVDLPPVTRYRAPEQVSEPEPAKTDAAPAASPTQTAQKPAKKTSAASKKTPEPPPEPEEVMVNGIKVGKDGKVKNFPRR